MPGRFVKAIVMSIIAAAMVAGRALADEPKPASDYETYQKAWHWPKVKISKETTYFTEPLRPDGGVDYVAALNRLYSKGVTPENNAAVAIWQAIGPKENELSKQTRKQYFAMLGMQELPKRGDYLVPLEESFGDRSTPQEIALLEQCCVAEGLPWSRKEYFRVATLLERNEKPLNAVVKGLKRPRLYLPLVPLGDVQLTACTDLTWAFATSAMVEWLEVRAMAKLYDGHVAEAWQDIRAIYRLGQMESCQPCVSCEGASAYSHAVIAAAVLTEYANLTAAQAKEYLEELQALPPMRPDWQSCNETERCIAIEQLMSLVDTRELDSTISMAERDEYGNTIERPSKAEQKLLRSAIEQLVANKSVDGTELLLRHNAWWNRLVEANKCSTWLETSAKFDALLAEARDEAKRTAEVVLSGKPTPVGKMSPKEKAQHLAKLVGLPYRVCVSKCGMSCEIELQTRENMVELALALAAYRVEHRGKYPNTLAELVPAYLRAIPKDLFTGEDFHYKLEMAGYALYSVGQNGKDDGGRERDCFGGDSTAKKTSAADDIVLRMPAKNIKQAQLEIITSLRKYYEHLHR